MNDILHKYQYTKEKKLWAMDDLHILLLRHALTLDTGIPPLQRTCVEIGSYRGRSTVAFIHALETGDIGQLHIIEPTPTPELRRVITETPAAPRIQLHTRPYWEIRPHANHLVLIDGDHRWPAIADTLTALTLQAPIIAMHDTHNFPTVPACWGAALAGDQLRQHTARHPWEDHQHRPGTNTFRGFLLSATFPIANQMTQALNQLQP
jgi:hypothetical protein